ncbi:NAD(P)-dependent oxidoreductase [Prauserella rugosa]|nr:NAD(P)-binding domain-containing protein [Prauserella rugosa]KMS89577.1 hypothetical protein ACZ91_19715 [Streptomyces regensis]
MTSRTAPQSVAGPNSEAVTVVGLGPMGRALASALLKAGHRVTVWNRTPAKAREVIAKGATLAGSPADALAGAEVAVFCVLDDDVVASVVERATQDGGDPSGLTLVNLTADSPARTRDLAAQLDALGITLVDGAVMTTAGSIGTAATRILYAGPREAYETHRDLLAAFGGTAHHLGADVAAAATFDVALLSQFWTSIAGLAQALALARAEGRDVGELVPHAVAMSQLVVDLLPGLAADFAAGRFSGSDSATIDSLSTSLAHLRSAFARSEVSTPVLDAIHSVVDDTARAGYGQDAPIRIAEAFTNSGSGSGRF